MRFSSGLALKNIKRKPFRAFAMAVLVMILSFALFSGAYVIISLQNGLSGYKARLGADIIVTPNSAKGHGTVDDVFLQGITGNYYMAKNDIDKIKNTEGIEKVTCQFFLTSAKASCCSSRVQIIGFDPETDFSVLPWIGETFDGAITDGDIVIGADVSMPADGTIKFYGENYHVAAQLKKTGTGLDQAVYTNMNTIKKMAQSAKALLSLDEFKNADIDTSASAVLIKVRDGYDIGAVTDDINIHVTKVQATSARSMISSVSDGLDGVSGIIGALTAGIWVLSAAIMMAAFAMISNERRKEFAVLSVIGASKKMIFSVTAFEAVLICLSGSAAALLMAVLISFSAAGDIGEMLSMPYLAPDFMTFVIIGSGAVLLPLLTGVLASLLSVLRITKNETGMLLREDA